MIRTEHLLMVPFSERHLTGRYLGWLNDASLMCFSEQRHKRHTLETCRDHLRSFENTPDLFWAIEEQGNLGHIGNISVFIDVHNSLADVGILIGAEPARGKGYGREAWGAVCRYLLLDGGIRKVVAGTMAENLAMLAIMEKSGMVPDGTRRRHYMCKGKEMDVIYMALFRDSLKQAEALR